MSFSDPSLFPSLQEEVAHTDDRPDPLSRLVTIHLAPGTRNIHASLKRDIPVSVQKRWAGKDPCAS